MKVILLADVKGTGKKDQVMEVSDGFARNYLLPRKLAVEATSNALHSIETTKKAEQHRKDMQKQTAIEQAANMKDLVVTVKVRAGENGKLFGSLTTAEIADALKAQHGISVDKRKIVVEDHIKTVGKIVAEVRLYPEVTGKLTVDIVAQ